MVLLDFWTGGCVNCTHAAGELRALEERFGADLVVLGVRTPKFPHEATPAALRAAAGRLDLRHPVLDDADRATWDAYAVKAWPTVVLLAPDGYVEDRWSGEGHGAEIGERVAEVLDRHRADGSWRTGPDLFVPEPRVTKSFRFPARLGAAADGGVLVADAGNSRVVELDADLVTERWSSTASALVEPRGFCFLPTAVAREVGHDLVVADAGGHALFGRRSDGYLHRIAGTGEPLRRREGGGPAAQQTMSTPEDVAWFDGQVVVAMAGVHQLWALDPLAGHLRVIAGTTAEGLRDGSAEAAWFAQPTGLAPDPVGDRLWFVDAETSALRWLRRRPGVTPDRSIPGVVDPRFANVDPVARPGYEVHTVVGQGLFEFGHLDGPAAEALMQHPHGLTVAPDGSVLVADTYNGAVRRVRPDGEVSTIARDLAEPTDVLVQGDTLVVVESAGHRLTRVPLEGEDCADLCRPRF